MTRDTYNKNSQKLFKCKTLKSRAICFLPVLPCRLKRIWSLGDPSSHNQNICSSVQDRASWAHIPLVPAWTTEGSVWEVEGQPTPYKRKATHRPQKPQGEHQGLTEADLPPGNEDAIELIICSHFFHMLTFLIGDWAMKPATLGCFPSAKQASEYLDVERKEEVISKSKIRGV